MRKALTIFLTLALAPIAFAEEPPRLAEWLMEPAIEAAISRSRAGLLVLDTTAYDAKPLLAPAEMKNFAAHLWHFVVGPVTSEFDLALNGGATQLASRFPPTLESLAKVSGDPVVWLNKSTDCRLWVRGEIALDAKDCPGAVDGKSLATAFRQILGFNAVVLAQRGRFLLVEGPTSALTFGGQGLLFQDSAGNVRLGRDERKGGAMLLLNEGSGRFGVYETFLEKKSVVKAVHVGSKVLLDDP